MFEEGLTWLMGRKFFLPNRTPGLEGDPLAILSIAIGVRSVRSSDLPAAAWVRGIADRAAALETDSWRVSMLTAAAGLVQGGAVGARPVSADLLVALEGKGCAQSSEDIRREALSLALDLTVSADERAVVRLAAIERLLAVEATADLSKPSVGDLVNVLQGVPAALKRWPREDKPRTKREGVAPQKWDLPTEYHV